MVNQILSHIKQLPGDITDDNSLVVTNEDDFAKLDNKHWTSITVKEELFEEMQNELILIDYPHVFHIYVQYSSFQRISSLTISSFPELILLTCEYESLRNVTKLTLSSIF